MERERVLQGCKKEQDKKYSFALSPTWWLSQARITVAA